GALWAYDGWSNLTIVSGEVRNPERNIPRALVGGMLAIILLYVLVNLAYFYVLTPDLIASVPATSSVATEALKKFVGPLAVSFMACGLLISTMGSLYNGILTGARIPYAMAQDRLFFQSLAKLSPGSRVPINALWIQAAWICVLTLSGSF